MDTDFKKKLEDLIKSYNYPCEWYETEPTKDDSSFVLTLLRIPYGTAGKGDKPRQVVFLQHGLAGSAATWLINSPSDSLGYVLADAGYDVWLGNVRGNMFSMVSTKYKQSDDKFWDWTVSVSVSVLKESGQNELVYIGHSQGTLIAFTGLGLPENKELASKVKAVIAFAPVATIGHTTRSLKDIAQIITTLEPILAPLHLHGVSEHDRLEEIAFQHKISREIIDRIVYFITETNLDKVDMSKISEFYPAGTSFKNMQHFAEMAVSGKCQRYHNGTEYVLADMTRPTYLFSGSEDQLADRQDVDYLYGQIKPNCKERKEIPDWDHADFVWGKTARV